MEKIVRLYEVRPILGEQHFADIRAGIKIQPFRMSVFYVALRLSSGLRTMMEKNLEMIFPTDSYNRLLSNETGENFLISTSGQYSADCLRVGEKVSTAYSKDTPPHITKLYLLSQDMYTIRSVTLWSVAEYEQTVDQAKKEYLKRKEKEVQSRKFGYIERFRLESELEKFLLPYIKK